MKSNNDREKELFRQLMSGTDSSQVSGETKKKTRRGGGKNKNRPSAFEAVPCGFKAVAGMDGLKQLFTDAVINVVENPECASAYGIHPPSVLLYGPPGCGKTYFVEKLSEEMGVKFYKISPDDIASPYIHGTQAKIGEAFKKMESHSPCLAFFDEFDAMVPTRSNNTDSANQNGEVNEFLCMLNGASKKGIYVIAATNRPHIIDKSVLRSGRFDEKIYVGMPDEQAREALFRLELANLPVADDIDYCKLARLTKGFNCSDISYIVSVASRKMFNICIKTEGKQLNDITQTLLEEVIAHKTPSVSNRELMEYERMQQEFSPRETERQPMAIGFH